MIACFRDCQYNRLHRENSSEDQVRFAHSAPGILPLRLKYEPRLLVFGRYSKEQLAQILEKKVLDDVRSSHSLFLIERSFSDGE